MARSVRTIHLGNQNPELYTEERASNAVVKAHSWHLIHPLIGGFRMPKTAVLEHADEIVLSWLGSPEASPAGPLFTGGKFAEADIVGAAIFETRGTCSSCTASRNVACC
jgi:hypothetical protein